MLAVFVFSICKILWPVDADKIANLAQHPKSLGTADLDHNFWTRNLSRSSKVSKDSDCSLESKKKTSAKYYHLTVGVQGQVKLAKKSTTYDVTHKKNTPPTKKICSEYKLQDLLRLSTLRPGP